MSSWGCACLNPEPTNQLDPGASRHRKDHTVIVEIVKKLLEAGNGFHNPKIKKIPLKKRR